MQWSIHWPSTLVCTRNVNGLNCLLLLGLPDIGSTVAKWQVIIPLCVAVDLELHLVDVARSALSSLKQGELPGFDFVGLAQTLGVLLPRQAFLLGTAEFDGDLVTDGAVVAIVVELFASVAHP